MAKASDSIDLRPYEDEIESQHDEDSVIQIKLDDYAQDAHTREIDNLTGGAIPTRWEQARSRGCSWQRALLVVAVSLAAACALVSFIGTRNGTAKGPLYSSTATLLQKASHHSQTSKTAVLASYRDQDISWTKDIPKDWDVLRYLMNGREQHVYLQYIIEHYDNLPDYVVFLHGHAQSWHQHEPAAWKLRALNLTTLDQEKFINLRCEHKYGCTRGNESEDALPTFLGSAHEPPTYAPLKKRVGVMTGKFWDSILKPQGFGDYPEEIGSICCAQFAVSKKAIRSRSLDFWRRLTDPLDFEVWQETLGEGWTLDHSGNVYEYLWHIFFGRPAVDCPDTGRCEKEFFSDAITCVPGPPRKGVSEKMNYVCSNVWDPLARFPPDVR